MNEHIDFINTHSFRPHRDYNWGIFGLILTSGPDSIILFYEPENPVHNIWKFVEFPCLQHYIATYVNGIGELRTFDFSQNKTYKATTRLEAYTPITNIETSKYEADSDDEEEDNRF